MQVQDLSLPTSSEPFNFYSQESFSRGVITLVDESKIPKNALKQADNILLKEDGSPSPRWGTDWYGVASPNGEPIDGAAYFETAAGAVHVVMVAGGNIYRSTDNAANWSLCTGATLTPGFKCDTEQAAGFLYIASGDNALVRYDGTTTLQVYTALTTPSAPTVTKTGLGGTTYTQYYSISAVNNVGFTVASTSGSVAVDRQRPSFDTSNFITVAFPAVTGAVRYDVFTGTSATEPQVYLDSISANGVGTQTYIDQGNALENSNVIAPTDNTTTGPTVGRITYVGSRLWATNDKNNPYRVWWTGSGQYIGYFSTSYDGGYIDLQKGSQFRPTEVADYRDGKGTPLATVWCRSKDGRGVVWQISLDTQTIGDFSFTAPSAYKLPGSRGTDAPDSVVNVLNDYMYYNSQAIYNLGSRAQYLNLLSTDESSSNIRPSVKDVSTSASKKVAAYYFDSKVFFSVAYNSPVNNATIVFDTEKKAWLPKAYTLGFEKFFQYTDTNSVQRLLAWKPGDNRLTQTGPNIQGDYGLPFETVLVTGLIPVSKNRFDYMWVEEAEVEFSQPADTINVELIGNERSRGFGTIKSKSIPFQVSAFGVGWSSFAWTTTPWTSTDNVPLVYSESSAKRYFSVQKELNNYQYRITTNTLMAAYVLRTLQINGTPTQSGKPRFWRV